MKNIENIRGIFLFLDVILLFLVNHYGMIYDVTKEKYDKKYKKNHSIRLNKFGSRGIGFAIPSYISDNSKIDEVQRIKGKYNKASISFWVGVLVVVFLSL